MEKRLLVHCLEALRRAGIRYLIVPSGPGTSPAQQSSVSAPPEAASAATPPPPASPPTETPRRSRPAMPKARPRDILLPDVVPNTTSETQQVSDNTWGQPRLSTEEKLKKLQALEERIRDCQRCPVLVQSRSQTVFGVGNPDARLCFVGEAPGADEDRLGEPFVGRAGQLLNRMIEAMGFKRSDVYICNVIKCRPPQNRTPDPSEVRNCADFLDEQLSIIQPEFICALGSVAAKRLLGPTMSLSRARGRVFRYLGAKVVVTYHPAYLLRNPNAKRDAWEDLQMLLREMGLPIPKSRR